MGALWSYDVYSQHQNTVNLIELNAEDHSFLEVLDSDLEISEEDQTFQKLPHSLSIVKHSNGGFAFIATRLSSPFYPVWQPPKIN